MRSTQFWVLLLASLVVTILYFKEITLSRGILHEQKLLVDDHETADTAATYETAWRDLALRVYQGSRQDPALMDLLNSENVKVHQGPPPGAPGASPAVGAGSPPGSMPATSSKPLANPSLPGHPSTP